MIQKHNNNNSKRVNQSNRVQGNGSTLGGIATGSIIEFGESFVESVVVPGQFVDEVVGAAEHHTRIEERRPRHETRPALVLDVAHRVGQPTQVLDAVRLAQSDADVELADARQDARVADLRQNFHLVAVLELDGHHVDVALAVRRRQPLVNGQQRLRAVAGRSGGAELQRFEMEKFVIGTAGGPYASSEVVHAAAVLSDEVFEFETDYGPVAAERVEETGRRHRPDARIDAHRLLAVDAGDLSPMNHLAM